MTSSLRSRVLVVLAVATIAPTLLVGALAIRRARADLEREVVRGHLAHIRALGSALDQTLQGARRSLELTAAWWADDRTADDVGTEDARRASERLVRRLRRQVPLIGEVTVLDADGRRLAGPPLEHEVGRGAHSFGGYVGDVRYADDGPTVPLVAQARSRTGELVGVFVARLDLRFVADALEGARLGEDAALLVVDGAGVPVARTDAAIGGASLRSEHDAVDLALGSSTEGSVLSRGTLGVYRNLSSFQSLRGVRWAIVLEQPEAAAFALARATTRDTALVAALVLVLALGLGALLASRLTRPLRDLAARADAIAGDDDAPLPPPPVRAPGEIGVLAQRFEDMARRIGERDELRAALAHGDRLSTVGALTAGVAHEINNPLTTILGYSNLLLEDKPDDHDDRAGLELIADEAARMQAIVGGLLDYARSEGSAPGGPTDVAPLLRRTAALLRPTLGERGVQVVVASADALPAAAGSDQALLQVLVNLVQNAAQASPDGGVITARARRDGDRLRIEVEDQGPGVPPADRERIFEPFHTSKEPGSGTGLGLAVCKHLVGEMRGRIEVGDGEGGRGARFTVVLPTCE